MTAERTGAAAKLDEESVRISVSLNLNHPVSYCCHDKLPHRAARTGLPGRSGGPGRTHPTNRHMANRGSCRVASPSPPGPRRGRSANGETSRGGLTRLGREATPCATSEATATIPSRRAPRFSASRSARSRPGSSWPRKQFGSVQRMGIMPRWLTARFGPFARRKCRRRFLMLSRIQTASPQHRF